MAEDINLTLGSESSTTSRSRLTGGSSDLLGYLKAAAVPSSTSTSDVVGVGHRRPRHRIDTGKFTLGGAAVIPFIVVV